MFCELVEGWGWGWGVERAIDDGREVFSGGGGGGSTGGLMLLASGVAASLQLQVRLETLELQLAAAKARAVAAELRLAAADASVVEWRNGSLVAHLQIASLIDDALAVRMDPNTTHTYLEVGCSDVETLDRDVLNRDPTAFLVSLEPLLEKYAVLLARGDQMYHGSKRNMASPLGRHHRRGVVLPVAVAPSAGMRTFHVRERTPIPY